MPARPRVLVNASAVGYYPDRGDDWQDETYPRGSGFLPEVCAAWEHAAMEAEHLGVRVVVIRIGLVMSARGGALKEMLTPFRWGVGGRLGSGKQWMPWVHLEDLARMFIWAAENPEVHGVINGVSPNPVTNREFTAMLAQKINRPAWVTAPQYFLKLILGEFADSLFVSQRVNPAKPIDLGFQYRFPELKQAFADLLNDD
jgi:uncharacterized protein (TIGR01777 family)